jgi:iron(III) transport system ATP-binding protein
MLTIRGLCKTYATIGGAVRAVDRVDLDIAEGRFLSLLGPSGSGKTTTLRCVAGLEDIDAGSIRIGETEVANAAAAVHAPAYDRDIGMVFQSYAIWPHLDVFENVAYPLRVRRPRPPKNEIAREVMEALSLVAMQDLARRPATALSGGQQQRVALARALVRRPRLLLLDEPLANLDVRLREQMQREISDLVRRLEVTTLAVTHDQGEAMAMADRIAVMEGGRVAQEDTPRQLYERPRTAFVASFLGSGSVLPALIESVSTDSTGVLILAGGAGRLQVELPHGCRAGDRVEVALHGEDLSVSGSPGDHAINTVAGRIERLVFRGSFVECSLRVGDHLVKATLPAAPQDSGMAPGTQMRLQIDSTRCVVLPT